MIYTIAAWVFLVGTLLICIDANHPKLQKTVQEPQKINQTFCMIVFLIGCIVRMLMLGTLPDGPNAEEALVAVQGKWLWQRGSFLGNNHFVPLLKQWNGENAGPFLSILTAPFVGLFGINPWSARLPLAILSILSMLAMYGIGKELWGMTEAKYMLLIQAICPYFILGSRMTISANAVIFLLPIAFYATIRGFRQKGWLYAGAVLFACLAYTYDLYIFIVPFFILWMVIIAIAGNKYRMHGIFAGTIGIVLVLPALLTVIVNLTGGEGYSLFGIIDIPRLENFDKANWIGVRMAQSDNPFDVLACQFWNAVVCGGIMQHVAHANINVAAFTPKGFYALYSLSFPLMLLGILWAVRCWFARKNSRCIGKNSLILVGMIVTAIMIVLFGNEGFTDLSGTTYCYDYSSMFFFDAVLMAIGLTRIEEKSKKGKNLIHILIGLNFGLLCVFLFGGEYSQNLNVNFPDYRDAAKKAYSLQQKTGYKVCFTDEVYPHHSPDQAAEALYLYSADADMRMDNKQYTAFYPGIFDTLEPDEIYIVTSQDAGNWDLDMFDYYEYGRYAVLVPSGQSN